MLIANWCPFFSGVYYVQEKKKKKNRALYAAAPRYSRGICRVNAQNCKLNALLTFRISGFSRKPCSRSEIDPYRIPEQSILCMCRVRVRLLLVSTRDNLRAAIRPAGGPHWNFTANLRRASALSVFARDCLEKWQWNNMSAWLPVIESLLSRVFPDTFRMKKINARFAHVWDVSENKTQKRYPNYSIKNSDSTEKTVQKISLKCAPILCLIAPIKRFEILST